MAKSNLCTFKMKVFYIICGVILTLGVLTGVVFKFVSVDDHHDQVCRSENCNQVAINMRLWMNSTVNPCDDFYEYACSSHAQAGGTMYLHQINIFNVVKSLLEKNATEGQIQSEVDEKVKRFYISCKDESELQDKLGSQPMMQLLQKFGGWPISARGFAMQNWNFQAKLEILHYEYSTPVVFASAVMPDLLNSSNHIIRIEQAGLTLPAVEYYLNSTYTSVMDAYFVYMFDVAVLLGARNDKYMRNSLKEIIKFETELAKITVASRGPLEKLYKIYNISALNQLAPVISWLDFFNNGFSKIRKQIKDEQIIGSLSSQYFSEMSNLIAATKLKTHQGKMILNNYMVWQLIHQSIPFLSSKFRNAKMGLDLEIEGWATSERICEFEVIKYMGDAVASMYTRDPSYPALVSSYAQAESMVLEIKSVFHDILEKSDWMDNVTRAKAQEKLAAMTHLIGHSKFRKSYQDLKILEEDYFGNVIRAEKYQLDENLKKFGQSIDKDEWMINPAEGNAYYDTNRNLIGISGANFLHFFSQIGLPKSIHFGYLGVILGHEIAHGFDPDRISFDKFGNLNPWIKNPTTQHNMDKKTDCLVQQMSGSFTMNGFPVILNGTNTLNEDFADIVGIKIAFKAYQKAYKDKDSGLDLPGQGQSHNQLFFLSFAQSWCYAPNEKELRNQLLTDPHSPSALRVRASLSNLQEFSEAYNCPLGSPMNPVNKCLIW